MIGLEFPAVHAWAAGELGELFKTPMEPVVEGGDDDVLLSTTGETAPGRRKLTLYFSDAELPCDAELGFRVGAESGGAPGVARAAVVEGPGEDVLLDGTRGSVMGRRVSTGDTAVCRFGYDLLALVDALLRAGQPVSEAPVPTLDRHIAMLRRLILEAGVPIVEVPPAPAGKRFVACFTHDVDFHLLSEHFLDRTHLGFAYRATVASVLAVLRGRMSVADLGRNLGAFLTQPLARLGLTSDPFDCVAEYLKAEPPGSSTFFFVPHAKTPGAAAPPASAPGATAPAGVVAGDGSAVPLHRAVGYDAADLAGTMQLIQAHGGEIAAHGLDGWHDAAQGEDERRRIEEISGSCVRGNRTHWLWQTPSSPQVLEEAGFLYDSSVGYNDAVGFRAGTTQSYRPSGCRSLLELPLNLQDTALLYPGRMGLSAQEALGAAAEIVDRVAEFGGLLVVNWHQRSLGPERLWGEVYRGIKRCLAAHRVWETTMGEASRWYRARRAIRFTEIGDGERRRVVVTAEAAPDLPPFSVVVRTPSGGHRRQALHHGRLHTETLQAEALHAEAPQAAGDAAPHPQWTETHPTSA
ncbi:MAG: hypothetical protein GVY14_01740 [Spirochaetes bacterium]|jgi:hypothetical protein|nr:hypothetical protein [Spirochaetota bacterium]